MPYIDRAMPEPTEVLKSDVRSDQPNLAWVEQATDLLDTKFTIPGTKIKFGADFILGMFPGVGDVVSLAFSGVLVSIIAKHGASKLLVARMLINVFLDAVVGSIPILGNVFDLFYKANHRNMILMRQYYQEGKHSGSVWPLVIGVIAITLLLIGFLTWALIQLIGWAWALAASQPLAWSLLLSRQLLIDFYA